MGRGPTIFRNKWIALALALVIAVPVQLFLGVEKARASTYPDSCQAVKTANPSAPDGEYFIRVAGKAVQLYCADMSTSSPKEYISLVNTGGSYNFSRYAQGGARPGTDGSDVTTTFTKIRFDPVTLRVDTTDLTFSSSTGYILVPDVIEIQTMSYATAADCIALNSSAGTANVNLVGTPFAVAAGEFVTNGHYPGGNTVYSSSNQIVDLTGGGYCGSTDSGADLQLELNGPTFELSTSSAYGGQATLTINYPAESVRQKFQINGGTVQSYGGTFLIAGNQTVTAYGTDSTGTIITTAESRIVVSNTAANLQTNITTIPGGSFSQGQSGVQYTIDVRNVGSAPTNGTGVTVTAAVTTGLTATALRGTGWSCTLGTLSCTRSDALAASASYSPITLTADVATTAPASVTMTASVAGGGEVGITNNSFSKSTTVLNSNAYLSMLTLSAGSGITGFDKLTTSYTTTVGYDDSTVTVTPTSDYSGAALRYRINGGSYSTTVSGVPTSAMPLTVGENTIEVEVTAANATTVKTYTVTVIRLSNDFSPVGHEISSNGSQIRIRFSEVLSPAEIDASKFIVRADGAAKSVTAATYDSVDPLGKSVILTLSAPIVYGQTVTLEIQHGAVKTAWGESISSRPAEPLTNVVEYDEQLVVALLRLELSGLDSAQDGIGVSELIIWIHDHGKDITGDKLLNGDDIRLLLKQVDVRTMKST